MRTLIAEIRSALLATLVLAVVCCGLYPLMVFGIGQLAFRQKANGSLIVDQHGVVRGSRLLGQAFAAAKYFHARPSAAGKGYDAANSGGSNLGPTSQALRDMIKERIEVYRRENGLKETDAVPTDAATASGSGLDPHITPESARLQIARVAAARGLAPATVAVLVEHAVEPPQCGFLGEPRVNVLLLNLTLDRLASPGRKE
jgi:potassium-transporting ATPase KdpC subunit